MIARNSSAIVFIDPPLLIFFFAASLIAFDQGITVEQFSNDLNNADYAAIREGMKVNADEIRKEVTARVKSILEICSLASMEKMALNLVTSGVSVEEARTKVMEAKANISKKTAIRSSVTSLGTGEVSPLVEDARQRAQAAGKRSVNK